MHFGLTVGRSCYFGDIDNLNPLHISFFPNCLKERVSSRDLSGRQRSRICCISVEQWLKCILLKPVFNLRFGSPPPRSATDLKVIRVLMSFQEFQVAQVQASFQEMILTASTTSHSSINTRGNRNALGGKFLSRPGCKILPLKCVKPCAASPDPKSCKHEMISIAEEGMPQQENGSLSFVKPFADLEPGKPFMRGDVLKLDLTPMNHVDESSEMCSDKDESDLRGDVVESHPQKIRDWLSMSDKEFKQEVSVLTEKSSISSLLSDEEWKDFCVRRAKLIKKASKGLATLYKDVDLVERLRVHRGHSKYKRNVEANAVNPTRARAKDVDKVRKEKKSNVEKLRM